MTDPAKARERETSIAKMNVALAPLKKAVAKLNKRLGAKPAPNAIEKVERARSLSK
jgi:hypothetical protein